MKGLLSCFGVVEGTQPPTHLPNPHTKDKSIRDLQQPIRCSSDAQPVLETITEALTDQRPLAALKAEGRLWRPAAYQDLEHLENLSEDSLTPIASLGEGAHGSVDLCLVHPAQQLSSRHPTRPAHSQQPSDTHLESPRQLSPLVVAVKKVEAGRQQERELLMLHRTQGVPFVTQFFGFIDDGKECKYLCEWAEGGDMADFLEALRKRRCGDLSRPLMSESSAAFYAACILLALEGLHHRKMIHRDVKPGNLLMMSNGIIKLSDFGFTVALDSKGKAVGCCGTQGYMAPEVWDYGLDNKYVTYGLAADLWSVGATIYELITGQLLVKVQEEVTARWSVPLHPCFSPELRSLLSKLLCVKPKRRLQSCAAVMEHPWFACIDWLALRKGQAEAPYMPAGRRKLPRQMSNVSSSSVPAPPTMRSQPLPQRLGLSTCTAVWRSADLDLTLTPTEQHLGANKAQGEVAASA